MLRPGRPRAAVASGVSASSACRSVGKRSSSETGSDRTVPPATPLPTSTGGGSDDEEDEDEDEDDETEDEDEGDEGRREGPTLRQTGRQATVVASAIAAAAAVAAFVVVVIFALNAEVAVCGGRLAEAVGGTATIRGTCVVTRQSVFLYTWSRSPTWKPWSLVKTTTVEARITG